MSEARVDLGWQPPGPVSARFMASRARVQIINGPVGSGKTTTCFNKAVRPWRRSRRPRAPPVAVEGRGRRAAGAQIQIDRDARRLPAIVALDDPQLEQPLPAEFRQMVRGDQRAGRHELTFALADGTAVEFIAEFVALGDNDIEEFMRGYEPTAFYLNELDLLAREVLQQARFRWGRYPRMDEGGPSWYGCLADCNAPILDSWLYNEIFLGTMPDVELFRLPGAFDPGAENRQNLVAGYYEGHLAGGDPYLIRRMVHNQPAPSRSGKPVHEAFNDLLHVAPAEIAPVPGLPLAIGMDAGLDPAAIIGQKLGNGHWLILDELVSEHGTGPVRFAQRLNELLSERYPDWAACRASGIAAERLGWAEMDHSARPTWSAPGATRPRPMAATPTAPPRPTGPGANWCRITPASASSRRRRTAPPSAAPH
jgi:hypothetical protein